MFKKSPKDLHNYLVSKTYLEYASWLLCDIENFLTYSNVPTKASKYTLIEKRFEEIESLILLGMTKNANNNIKFQDPFDILYKYTASYYQFTYKDFLGCLRSTDDSSCLGSELLSIINFSMRSFDGLQAFLPIEHYEFYTYEANKFSAMAFTECFSPDKCVTTCNHELAIEYSNLAMDMLEKSYQAIDGNSFLAHEYEALNLFNNIHNSQLLECNFKNFKNLLRAHIACTYRENYLLKKLFYMLSFDMESVYSDDVFSELETMTNTLQDDLSEASACTIQTALLLNQRSLESAGTTVAELEMLMPPLDLEGNTFGSSEYYHLSHLLAEKSP